MKTAAIYKRKANKEASEIGKFFEVRISPPYRARWQWANLSLTSSPSADSLDEKIKGLEELEHLAQQRCPTFPLLLPNYQAELKAAIWWRLGEAYTDKDNSKALEWYEIALAKFEQEIDLREAAAEVYFYVANDLDKMKEYVKEIEKLTKAIKLKPKYAFAYNNRGLAYADIKRYEEALADYTQAIALDPKDAFAYNNRGLAYNDRKEYKQAIADYTQAIALNHNYARAYNYRAITYLWLHNSAQASADYNSAYQLDPKDINAVWMSLWADMGRQRSDVEIATRLKSMAEIDTKDYVAYVCRGLAFGLRSELLKGLTELEEAISLEPVGWDAYFWKGMLCAYYYRGRHSMAMEAIVKALEVGLPPILLMPLYWLETDRPEFFEMYAKPLLERYGV